MNHRPVPPRALKLPETEYINLCQAIIQKNSKSFAFASSFLPKEARADAAVLYAWCRHVDDSIDEIETSQMPQALENLHRELNAIYEPEPQSIETQLILSENVILCAFRSLVRRLNIPKHYPLELIKGMRMDVESKAYVDLEDLYLYCYRVASVVGLMMCYVLGVKEQKALLRAAYLGLAMQITNICRDVSEDWGRGRLYLPLHMLCSGSTAQLQIISPDPSSDNSLRFNQASIPSLMVEPIQIVTSDLLKLAQIYYQRGFLGLKYLPWQSSLAIHAAGLIYKDIGRIVIAQRCDPNQSRAITSKWRKIFLSSKALGFCVFSIIPRCFAQLVKRPSDKQLVQLRFQDLLQDIIDQQNPVTTSKSESASDRSSTTESSHKSMSIGSLPQHEKHS